MKTSIAFLVATMMFLSMSFLPGQNKLGIELRGGADFAITELGDAELKTGLGFEGLVDYRFSRYLGAYLGWGWNEFSADRSFAGNNMTFNETGYLFGLQLTSTGTSKVGLYIRAGAVLNHIEVETQGGDILGDSKHGLGFRLETGADLGLGSNWYLKPGIKYQELSRDVTIETVTTSLDLKYLGVSLGIAKRF